MAHVEAMRRHAEVLELVPLTAAQIAGMLQSVFGDAVHLPRLADLVAQRSEGNPGNALDLVEHLVQQGLVRYGEGTWAPTLRFHDGKFEGGLFLDRFFCIAPHDGLLRFLEGKLDIAIFVFD